MWKIQMLKTPKGARVVTADVTLIGVLEKGVVKLYGVRQFLSASPPHLPSMWKKMLGILKRFTALKITSVCINWAVGSGRMLAGTVTDISCRDLFCKVALWSMLCISYWNTCQTRASPVSWQETFFHQQSLDAPSPLLHSRLLLAGSSLFRSPPGWVCSRATRWTGFSNVKVLHFLEFGSRWRQTLSKGVGDRSSELIGNSHLSAYHSYLPH